MFGRGGDTLGDQALDSTLGSALGASGPGGPSRIEGRLAVALVENRRVRDAVALGGCARSRILQLSFLPEAVVTGWLPWDTPTS